MSNVTAAQWAKEHEYSSLVCDRFPGARERNKLLTYGGAYPEFIDAVLAVKALSTPDTWWSWTNANEPALTPHSSAVSALLCAKLEELLR